MSVFSDYGLGFKQADFSGLTQGVGGYYSNKAKRDRFADLVNKDRFARENPGVTSAPVLPHEMDIPLSGVKPSDPYFNKMMSQGGKQGGAMYNGVDIEGGNQSPEGILAGNQYMDALSNYDDQGVQAVSYGDAEAEYDAEKAVYDQAQAAGFEVGENIQSGLLGSLRDVDEEAALSKLGYQSSSKSATGNFLSKREDRAKASNAQAIADEAWGVLSNAVEGSPEYNQAKAALNQAAREFQQFSGKAYKAPGDFTMDQIIEKENRETTKVKNSMADSIKGYTKGFISTRAAVTKDHNQAANNAKAFNKAFAIPLSTASYQAMLKAVNKMLEPNSAVMQGEADAFMGMDAANQIRGTIESVTTGLRAISDGSKGQSATQADKNELGRLYNALLEKMAAGKAAVESGTGSYFADIKGQLQAEYGDSLRGDDFEELMDRKRFKSLLFGQMYRENLPGAVKIGKATIKNTPSNTPPPAQGGFKNSGAF
tara:strand:+ start:116 stop:1564 length:1449 start_codon:yes stop_codon:yes gene_type:complete